MNKQIDKKYYLNKLHKDLIRILDEVDRICQAYHLRYYLTGGSCLGAIRHNGFIPWDDDLDIVMPRKDFDDFISLINGQTTNGYILDGHFYLRWITTEKNYNQDFAKVCIKGTVFQENEGLASHDAGIFLDIFPLESSNRYSRRIALRSRIYKYFHGCLYLKGAEKKEMDWSIIHWPRNIISKVLSNKNIYKIMLWVIRNKRNSNEYQAFFASPYPIERQIFPNSWHGEGKRMLFEGRHYMCPSEADRVMESFYGPKYMELPPYEKRKTHCPIRVVFSDGEELIFGKNEKKLSYIDILE